MSPAAPVKPNNTHIIAGNSFWYGIELVFGTLGAFLTSILVARVIGPERLGYFQVIVWLTNITTSVESFGLPLTTRKYMAEYLNRGEAPVARAIYAIGLRLQLLIACALAAVGLVAVFVAGDPAYHLVSTLLVINVAPRMIGLIPSQANNAAELMRRSTAPALIGGGVNIGLALFSLWVGWDLVGVAAAFLAGSVIETGIKLYDVHRRLAPVPAGKLSPELKQRMWSYSGQGLVLLLLNVVVWDRSDLLILKLMNPDIKQVAFFSLAFNLTERVLALPTAFSHALGTTMMAQYGRGRERLEALTVTGAKYALLMALPLLAGMACVSGPLARLLYGEQYTPIIPVLAITAALAIPKALNNSATSFLQTTESQGYLIWVGCIGGVLDIGMDFLLTPTYGAVAGIANGTAQALAAAAIWWRTYRIFGGKLPLGEFGRVVLSGLFLVGAVLATLRLIEGYAGVALAVAVGVTVWAVALRVTGALNEADRKRFEQVGRLLPGRVRPTVARLIAFVAPAAA